MKTGLIIIFILISFFTGLFVNNRISNENKMALEIHEKDSLIRMLIQRVDSLDDQITIMEEEQRYEAINYMKTDLDLDSTSIDNCTCHDPEDDE